MASKVKKKKSGGKPKGGSFKASLQGADSSRNKNVIRVLIVAVVVIFLVEAMNLFHGSTAMKEFKVKQLVSITSDSNACGHFTGWGIAPAGRDRFVVVDQQNARLVYFDMQGKFIKSVGKKGSGPKEFNEPSGATYDAKGNVYVMDTWNGAIKGYDADGKQVSNLDLTKFKNFYGPRGIAFDGRDFIVTDTGSHRVVLLTPTGNLEATWGSNGTGSGQFKGPLAATGDGKGNYYVADTDNSRLQCLDKDGKVFKIIKSPGNVWAVAVDSQGRIYSATNADNGSIKVYSAKGSYLGDLRDANGSADAFRGAHGLTISADDTLFLTVGSTAAVFKLPATNP